MSKYTISNISKETGLSRHQVLCHINGRTLNTKKQGGYYEIDDLEYEQWKNNIPDLKEYEKNSGFSDYNENLYKNNNDERFCEKKIEENKADYVQLQSGIEKKKAKYGEKLYHYTSLNSFIGMVKNREIWMSSTGSMNDRKETLYFIEMMERELCSYGRNDFFERVRTQIPLNYKYAFCLSTEEDDAAQWERYGDSAMGVCLAFNVEELYKCLYGYHDIMFNEVFYTDSVVDEMYFRVLKKYFETGKIDIYSTEEELIKQLIYAGNLHKHKSFKNEYEIRITTLDNKNQYGTEYALKEIGNVVKKVLILRPDIMGYSKGISFDNLIDKVILGPRSQQNKNILEQFIFANGLKNIANSVIMSDCPLR